MKGSIQGQIIIVIFLLLFVMPLSAFSADGQIKISQAPYIITKPGSYVLTNNVRVSADEPDTNAITIESNDVTLDLNGHTIQGPNLGEGAGNGIYARDRFNITITNGRIWGFGFSGIYLSSTQLTDMKAGHRIENIHSSNNNYIGIDLVGGGIIVNCVANNNKFRGIYAKDATINNCTANNNKYAGFEVSTCTITSCTANGNIEPEGDGFRITRCLLSSCNAHNNMRHGIDARASVVSNCSVTLNKGYGINMGLDLVNGKNYIYRNAVSENQDGQIFCPGNGTDNICEDNAVW